MIHNILTNRKWGYIPRYMLAWDFWFGDCRILGSGLIPALLMVPCAMFIMWFWDVIVLFINFLKMIQVSIASVSFLQTGYFFVVFTVYRQPCAMLITSILNEGSSAFNYPNWSKSPLQATGVKTLLHAYSLSMCLPVPETGCRFLKMQRSSCCCQMCSAPCGQAVNDG